jgi:hypothetical protein
VGKTFKAQTTFSKITSFQVKHIDPNIRKWIWRAFAGQDLTRGRRKTSQGRTVKNRLTKDKCVKKFEFLLQKEKSRVILKALLEQLRSTVKRGGCPKMHSINKPVTARCSDAEGPVRKDGFQLVLGTLLFTSGLQRLKQNLEARNGPTHIKKSMHHKKHHPQHSQ